MCLEDNLLNTLSREKELVLFEDWWFGKGAIQNAFFGAIPQHPFIGKTLELILNNVQSAHYGGSVLCVTGPCLLGMALNKTLEKKLFAHEDVVAGHYTKENFFFYNNTKVVNHKCKNCGTIQDWPTGNNYSKLHKEGHYYCEDAKSLFQTI